MSSRRLHVLSWTLAVCGAGLAAPVRPFSVPDVVFANGKCMGLDEIAWSDEVRK